MKILINIFICIIIHNSLSQNTLLDSLLKNLPAEYKKITELPNKYRFQLIYTRIQYISDTSFSFYDYYYNYSDTVYSYPASMVKFPISVAAIKKMEILSKKGADLNSKIIMDSLFCQKALTKDSIGYPQYPHLRKWIKRMLIISDNEAYTHTYDFINCKTLHAYLKEWQFDKARLSHKFVSKCMDDTTYYTPTVYILNEKNDTIFIQYQDSACKFNIPEKNYSVGYTIKKVKRKRKTTIQRVPKVFVKHNDWPLIYSHQLMKYIIFDNKLKIINLNPVHRDSLIKYMGSYPREYPELSVDSTVYYDTWKKFFIYGGRYKRIKQDTLRSINIIGRAYGFLSETAYITDFKNHIDFILSATVYLNPNDIMDGKYDYELAYQLFYHISRLIYEYEKKFPSKTSQNIGYYEKLFRSN